MVYDISTTNQVMWRIITNMFSVGKYWHEFHSISMMGKCCAKKINTISKNKCAEWNWDWFGFYEESYIFFVVRGYGEIAIFSEK